MDQTTSHPDAAATGSIPEWWPHVILGVASALLVTLLLVTIYYANTARQLLTDLQEYAWQVDRIDALLIELLNAESGARGFLVAGEQQYLDAYIDSVSRMDELLGDMDSGAEQRQLHARQYDLLKRLIAAELQALSAAIDARQTGGDPLESLMNRGNRMMDAIRSTLNTLRSHLSADSATNYVNSLSFLGKSRWVVVSLFTAAFALLLGLFVLIQKQVDLRRHIAAMMSTENERLEKLVKRRTVELNDLATYLTRVSEIEKQHIARELHDEMGALLTAARMDVTWIIRDLDPDPREKYSRRLQRLSESLDAAISLKRKITTDLKPPLLQELGLVESVRALVDDLAVDGAYDVDIDLPDGPLPLDNERTLAVFRIIQESLTNIRKYADARKVQVHMSVDDRQLKLRVADDGRGFVADSARGTGHGLSGMRHRAQMFSGRLQVTSQPGQGTVIEAQIPIQAAG